MDEENYHILRHDIMDHKVQSECSGMHACPLFSGHIYVTGEKMLNTVCPVRGSNQDLLCGSQTLYCVAIKAGLYRKAVQVCIIPNITSYYVPVLDYTSICTQNRTIQEQCTIFLDIFVVISLG